MNAAIIKEQARLKVLIDKGERMRTLYATILRAFTGTNVEDCNIVLRPSISGETENPTKDIVCGSIAKSDVASMLLTIEASLNLRTRQLQEVNELAKEL